MRNQRPKQQSSKRDAASSGGKKGSVGMKPPAQFSEENSNPTSDHSEFISGQPPIQGAFTIKRGKTYSKENAVPEQKLIEIRNGSYENANGDAVANEVQRLAGQEENIGAFSWKGIIEVAVSNVSKKRKTTSKKDEEVLVTPKKKTKLKETVSDDEKEEKEEKKDKSEEDIEVEKIREDKMEESESKFTDVRSIFQHVFDKYKLKDMLLKSIVSDIDFDEIDYLKAYTDLDEIEDNEQREKEVLKVSSCFDTAKRLLKLLGKGKLEGNWSKTVKLHSGVKELKNLLRSMEGKRCIIRAGINNNAHGFALICRNDKVELLQGFANAESLAQNIEKTGNSYDTGTVCGYLDDLLKYGKKESEKAQERLFGGNIDMEKVEKKNNKKQEEMKNEYYKTKKSSKTEYPKYYMAANEDQKFDDYVLFYRDMNDDDLQLEYRTLQEDSEMLNSIDQKVSTGLKALGYDV